MEQPPAYGREKINHTAAQLYRNVKYFRTNFQQQNPHERAL